MKKHYFAVDLGATSGRTVLATLDDGRLEMEEVSRFDNALIETDRHVYWDLMALYNEIIKGLRIVARREIAIESIGIDTWGVDFVCIGSDGEPLRNPLSYRDTHTQGMMEQYFREVMPADNLYSRTGIQFMNFNSLFQLYAMQRAKNSALQAADKILFLPDALGYLLTGEAVMEYTIASTSQMLNPFSGDLDEEILSSIGLQRKQFAPIVQPGTVMGKLTPKVQKITGMGDVAVVAVAGHDTASAVAAVPASNAQFAYLSSGTWSLMGIETPKAIINERSRQCNFTNEGGVDGTTRFLKNICGMWIYERCRKEWEGKTDIAHTVLQSDAMQCEAFRSLINPDDPSFANPECMTATIDEYCIRTHQPVPRTPAEYCRCIFESLALCYRQVMGWLNEFADFPIDTLHIIGGGSVNRFLNQFTANACCVEVLAGPQECTALGNVMLQAKATGQVDDIWQMRSIIAQNVKMEQYHPQDKALWAAAYERWMKITQE